MISNRDSHFCDNCAALVPNDPLKGVIFVHSQSYGALEIGYKDHSAIWHGTKPSLVSFKWSREGANYYRLAYN